MVFTLLIILGFFSVSLAQAQLESGQDYVVTSSFITFSEENIETNQSVRIIAIHETTAEIEIMDHDFQATGQREIVSRSWLERSLRNLTLNETISLAFSFMETQNEFGNLNSCAPQTSPRPRARPQRELTDIRGSFDTARYFECYRSNSQAHDDYVDRYSSSISRHAQVYAQVLPELDHEDLSTLFSCLFFRESAHWQGGVSSTGAVGLGQFTGIAINQVQAVLEYQGRDNFEERKQIQQSEFEAKRLSQDQLSENLEMIANEERNYRRMTELQDLWGQFNLTKRPTASEITVDFLADNQNFEVIFALSMLLVRECQIRAKENNIQMDQHQSLLACLGAYNMGYAAFSSEAFNRTGPQSTESWVSNLRLSTHHQRDETADHLISILRCSSPVHNLPPCATQANYCQELEQTNPCALSQTLLCSEECL